MAELDEYSTAGPNKRPRLDSGSYDDGGEVLSLKGNIQRTSDVNLAEHNRTVGEKNPVSSKNAELPAVIHSLISDYLPEQQNGVPPVDNILPTSTKPDTTVTAEKVDNSSVLENTTESEAPIGQGEEEEEDMDDNVSEISDLSGLSEAGWRPVAGPISWVQRQMMMGSNPRDIIKDLLPELSLPDDTDDLMLWKLVVNILSEPVQRKKLSHINTIDDVVDLMRKCKKIMVLTGAGVSVSCGIPDFRSKDGIYARIAVDYPDLKEPQDMFDIHLFLKDPRPFFKFAKEIFPGQFHPSRCHRFIRKIEEQNKLLRNYTQNIDTLEQTAGIENVIQCHGSFVTATCVTCKYKCNAEDIRADIMNQVIPRCPKCPPDSSFPVMKPDIVFFGEGLSEEFHRQMEKDKDECDLLIVIGSSLKVRPVALIPNSLPADCPQVLINRERLPHLNFDVELLGDCDVVVNELCQRLGDTWSDICGEVPLEEVLKDSLTTPLTKSRSPVTAVEENSQQSTTREFTQLTVRSNSVNSSLSDLQSENGMSPSSASRTDSDLRQRDSECSSDSAIESGSGGEEGEIESHKPSADVSLEEEDEDNAELDSLREMWNSKRSSLASRLSSGSFLYLPPSRYVFKGAEVYSEEESNSDSESSSSESDSEDETTPRETNHLDNRVNNNSESNRETNSTVKFSRRIESSVNEAV